MPDSRQVAPSNTFKNVLQNFGEVPMFIKFTKIEIITEQNGLIRVIVTWHECIRIFMNACNLDPNLWLLITLNSGFSLSVVLRNRHKSSAWTFTIKTSHAHAIVNISILFWMKFQNDEKGTKLGLSLAICLRSNLKQTFSTLLHL